MGRKWRVQEYLYVICFVNGDLTEGGMEKRRKGGGNLPGSEDYMLDVLEFRAVFEMYCSLVRGPVGGYVRDWWPAEDVGVLECVVEEIWVVWIWLLDRCTVFFLYNSLKIRQVLI